jgi:hypothetical protein
LGRIDVAALAVLALLGTAYARTLAPSITWANDGADSGDLVAAAATLGVAHPTGYPTYLLLARLFQFLPIGDLALRVNLLSAAAAALAALSVYALVTRLAVAEPPALVQNQETFSANHQDTKTPSIAFKALMTWCLGGSFPRASLEIALERRGGEDTKMRGSSPRRLVAAAAALALGLSPIFWSQAVIAEVYTLHALFAGLILLWILQALRGVVRDGWIGRLQAVAVGLALGNHVTIAPLALIWLVAPLAAGRTTDDEGRTTNDERRPTRNDEGPVIAYHLSSIVYRLLWVGIGALVYLYLPLRAAARPPINWGNAQSWQGFWWLVSGQPYRGFAFGVAPSLLGGRAAAWAVLLMQQFGWIGLALGFVGLLYGAPRDRRFVWLTAALAVLYSAFALSYDSYDSYTYLIPVYLIFAAWIGLGALALLEAVERSEARVFRVFVALFHKTAEPQNRRFEVPQFRNSELARSKPESRLRALLAALLLVVMLARAPATALQVDASADRRATDFAARALAAAPNRAIVLAQADRDIFALWYAHYALGRRPDLIVIAEPLLAFGWYRENLRAVEPGLALPEPGERAWPQLLASANPGRGPVCRSDADDSAALACDVVVAAH